MIGKWWLKCSIQFALSYLPMGGRISQMWRYVKRSCPDLHAINTGISHVRILQERGISLTDKVVLEIGTGWKPFLPYIFRIAGCERVILCDLNRHMNLGFLQTTLSQVRERVPDIAKAFGMDVSDVESKLPLFAGQDFETLLKESGFEYRAPFDVRHTDYPDKSIDIVNSHAVLEHIPPQDITALLHEIRRILRPMGAMVHTIDHSDHWQHFDHSISSINFLKFSREWWRVINSPITYQNRLRSCEYVRLIKEAGFNIIYLDDKINQKAMSDIQRLKIHPDFQIFKSEELAVLVTYLVAQPL